MSLNLTTQSVSTAFDSSYLSMFALCTSVIQFVRPCALPFSTSTSSSSSSCGSNLAILDSLFLQSTLQSHKFSTTASALEMLCFVEHMSYESYTFTNIYPCWYLWSLVPIKGTMLLFLLYYFDTCSAQMTTLGFALRWAVIISLCWEMSFMFCFIQSSEL